MQYPKVLLTGVTGFIAKRIAYDLLRAGHQVTGSLRNTARQTEVIATLRANGLDDGQLANLSFTPLDLTSDDGWEAALAGHDALIHTASPFPLGDAGGEAAIVTPALAGTKRALTAAHKAGVQRVVLTSSTEAIMHCAANILTEACWTDLSRPSVSAYTKSKTLAERAAWEFAAQHPDMQLTVINPGMVVGRPLDEAYGSSIKVVKRIFSGKDPMLPDLSLPVVDLEDVAAAHVAALGAPDSIGQRYLLTDRMMTMLDMADSLRESYPDRRFAKRRAPKWIISAMALFDGTLRQVKNMQGWHPTVDHSAAQRDLGITFTPAPDALLKSAAFLAQQQRG